MYTVQCQNILLAPFTGSTHQNIADVLTNQSARPQFSVVISYAIDLCVRAMIEYVSRA